MLLGGGGGGSFWKLLLEAPLTVLASAGSWACRRAVPIPASLVTGLSLRALRGSDGDPSRWTQGPPEIQDTLISTPLSDCIRKDPFSKEDRIPGLWELGCARIFAGDTIQPTADGIRDGAGLRGLVPL